MKKYTFKLILSFVIIFLLLGFLIAYAYNSMYQAFIITNAETEMSLNGENLAEIFNRELDFDYNTFSKTVMTNPDPIKALNEMDYVFSFYGFIGEEEIIINNSAYDFQVEHLKVKEFNNVNYMTLIKNDYVAFLDLDEYLSQILKTNYIFMDDNNLIHSNNVGVKERFFYDVLRNEEVSEIYIDKLKNDIFNKNTVTFEKTFKDVKTFYTLVAVKNYYIIIVKSSSDVLLTQKNVTYSLLAMMGGLFLILSAALIILFRVLSQRLSDIELAKYSYYYNKPYIFYMKRNGKIRSINRSLKEITDFPHHIDELELKETEDIKSYIDKQASFTVVLSNGNLLVRFLPLKKHLGYLFVGENVTKEELLYDEYEKVALYNKITDLPNRNSLIRDLTNFDINKKNALIALDVVSFGKLNLYLGDNLTNHFLNVFKDLIFEQLTECEMKLYNLERDRFVIMCQDLKNYNDAISILDKLFTRFRNQIQVGSTYINIDIKAGILYLDEKNTPDSIVFNLITALKHAKVSQVNDYIIYDQNLSLIASREEMMEKDLAFAIKNNELYCLMQPQFDNVSRRISGVEVLLRWDNPKYSKESPEKFITIAEQNNMIVDIGKFIITETAKIAKELEEYDVRVSFNVSPVQLLQTGFVDEVINIFKQYDVKPEQIGIEVTENFLISSFELIINKLKLLKQKGYKIYLDDFGSKYSSLQYLRNLPVDAVKIDRAFIKDIEADKHSVAIVSMITNLTKNIGLETIAEGVETVGQNNIVFKNGCNIVQGYIISKPIDVNDAKILIEGYNVTKTLTLGKGLKN